MDLYPPSQNTLLACHTTRRLLLRIPLIQAEDVTVCARVNDPPAPVRPLIQMMNQEIVRGTTFSDGPLMANYLQGGVRHFLSATDVDKTTII